MSRVISFFTIFFEGAQDVRIRIIIKEKMVCVLKFMGTKVSVKRLCFITWKGLVWSYCFLFAYWQLDIFFVLRSGVFFAFFLKRKWRISLLLYENQFVINKFTWPEEKLFWQVRWRKLSVNVSRVFLNVMHIGFNILRT